jgi:hypothetical protein
VVNASSFAQIITGSITGTVTDPSGAVAAGAKVTATNALTGIATSTSTNDSGVYSLGFLQIGQYKISVDASGFSSQSTSVLRSKSIRKRASTLPSKSALPPAVLRSPLPRPSWILKMPLRAIPSRQ